MRLKDHLNKKHLGIPFNYDEGQKINIKRKNKITSINYRPYSKKNLGQFKEKVIEKSKTNYPILNKTNSNFQIGRRKTTHIQIDSNKMATQNNNHNKENIQINCYNYKIEDLNKNNSQKEIKIPERKKNHSLDNKKILKDKKEKLSNEKIPKINNFNTNENIYDKEKNNLLKEEIEDENKTKKINLMENENQNIISKNDTKNSKIIEKSKKKRSKPSSAKKFIPILILNTGSSNSENNNSNKSFSSSNYETSGIDVKGEFIKKDQKTDFLDKMKKRLFNNPENKITHNNKRLILNLKKDIDDSSFINLENNIIITERQENMLVINSSVLTNAGTINDQLKTNQDSYSIIENIFAEKLYIYGVFDGHGQNSEILSSFISNYIKKYFSDKKNYIKFYNNNIKNNKNNNTEKSETELAAESSLTSSEITESNYSNSTIINTVINSETLKKIFQYNNQQFIKESLNSLNIATNELNFDLSYCGSTCILIYIIKNILICSNIGDSKAILFSCSNEDRWTYEPLSIDHKPDNPNEKKRILENGGEIHQHIEKGIAEGPNRVYVKGKSYPGLSMTRSVGDSVGKNVGIIFEPDIIVKNIEITSKFLVIGSDGFWDVMLPYDVSRIASPYFVRGDCEGACKMLMKRAMKYWSKGDDDRDDITIIVVFIGKPNQKMIDTSKKDDKN